MLEFAWFGIGFACALVVALIIIRVAYKAEQVNDAPMFITTPTDNELERMRVRLETANDEKRNSYKLVAELRDKIKAMKTSHEYRVVLTKDNGNYDSYRFDWNDGIEKDFIIEIEKFLCGTTSMLTLADSDKQIYIKDANIVSIVVSKEDE